MLSQRPAAARTRLGVLGWPVAHSRSPQMHNAALRALGLARWRYQLLPVPPEVLTPTVTALPRAGFRGANVTIPHKEVALALADEISAAARSIGAVNTLVFEDGGAILADNTDAPAFLDTLPFSPRGKTAMVLGAGGSARAAAWALLSAGAAEVRVWNRHPARARAMCSTLGCVPVSRPGPADLLVNCTPVGLDGAGAEFKRLRLRADEVAMFECVVDLVYARAETPLVAAARSRGIPVVDGLDLLVAQGALSFERFTGRAPPVEVMRAAVR